MTNTQRRLHAAAIRLFAETGSTRITVTELAESAGVARATVYNNLDSPDRLFEAVAAQLANEMYELIEATLKGIEDPRQRLANGIRLYLRRAHEQPAWGRFITQFTFNAKPMEGLLKGPPTSDLMRGLSEQKYAFQADQMPSVAALIEGSVIASVADVLKGHQTWRKAGIDTAEFVLRAFGVSQRDASQIANTTLPEFPPPRGKQ